MPEGPLGFPRVTDIGPFVTSNIGWVLHPEVYDHLWDMVDNSDLLNFGPDPPVLIVHDHSSLDNELLQEQLFTRVSGKEYKDKYLWEKIPTRFSTGGKESDLERVYTKKSLKLFPDMVKYQSQLYTNSGAMVTFDFKQEYNGEVSGFMRAPVTDSMLREAKQAVEGLPHVEFFKLQQREESSEFGNVTAKEAQIYQHPHFRSTGVKTRKEMEKVFDVLIELSEEYQRQR